jgi:hypothetical protein
MKKTLLAFVLMTACVAAQAQTAPTNAWRFVGSVGVTAGGDELAIATYANDTSVEITAGGGFQMMLGAEYRINPQFSVQGTAGYHIHFTPEASNGDADFSRIPVELIGYFHASEKWRFGAGVRFVNSPKLSGSGFASGIDMDLDNTTSGLVEVEYLMNRSVGFKLRAVSEKYEKKGYFGSADANHVGIFANVYF